MELECIHFARGHEDRPDDTYDLLSVFTTLTVERVPVRTALWVTAHVLTDPEEGGEPVPLELRITNPEGGRLRFTQLPVAARASGLHPPSLSWSMRFEADFERVGYYTFEVIEAEWHRALGSKRLLLVART